MKKDIQKKLIVALVFVLTFSFCTFSAKAAFIQVPGSISEPTPSVDAPDTPVLNLPWIGNLTVSASSFNLGLVSPLKLSYDYQNLPEAASLPTAIIYKEGDVAKTDLSANPLDYNEMGHLSDSHQSGLQSGTEHLEWYGMTTPYDFVQPGNYVLEVSWQYNAQKLSPVSLVFQVTNTNNLIPLNFYDLKVLPGLQVNLQQAGNMNFTYTLKGLSGGELVNVTLWIGNLAQPALYFQSPTQLGLNNGTYSIQWDGKDTSSQMQLMPDGDYGFMMVGKSNKGRIFRVKDIIKVDSGLNTPPIQLPDFNNVVQVDEGTPSDSSNASNSQPTPTPVQDGQCAGIKDVTAKDSDCPIYTWLKEMGIMTGDSKGNFNLKAFLTKDQGAKIVLQAFGLFDKTKDYCLKKPPFGDVSASAWSFQYICRGKMLGIITGTGGKFLPGKTMNVAEFLALTLRRLDQSKIKTGPSYDDVSGKEWFGGVAKYSKDNGLFLGKLLNPSRAVTREEVAKVIYKLYKLGEIKGK